MSIFNLRERIRRLWNHLCPRCGAEWESIKTDDGWITRTCSCGYKDSYDTYMAQRP